MTQSLKSQEYDLRQGPEDENKYLKVHRQQKIRILNYLFRYITFTTRREEIRAIPRILYRQMSNKLQIDIIIVHNIVSRFLVDLIRIKKFINENSYVLYSKNRATLVRSYIHKFYRLAPVFDYNRARENVKILKMKLDAHYFWPLVTTQVAVVIYITDKLDPSQKDKILQTNLRSLCNCSAYAFHRTRNKIGLNKQK